MAPRKAERKVRKMKSYEFTRIGYEVMAAVCAFCDEMIEEYEYGAETGDYEPEKAKAKVIFYRELVKAIENREGNFPWDGSNTLYTKEMLPF